jgi:hypothetical protein
MGCSGLIGRERREWKSRKRRVGGKDVGKEGDATDANS